MKFYKYENPYVVLSERDEFVPESHIGMYSLLRNPKNKGVFMGEARVCKVREETFGSVLKLYRKYGSPDFADFYNRNAEVITEIGMNHFSYNQKLLPIADMIECFLCKTENGSLASFGISKQILRSYLISLKDKTPFDRDLYKTFLANPPNKNKSRDFIIFGADKIDLFDGNTVSVDKNALYRRFCDWCELQGVEKQEGVMMALESLLEAYPLEAVKENTDYDFLTNLMFLSFINPKKRLIKWKEKFCFLVVSLPLRKRLFNGIIGMQTISQSKLVLIPTSTMLYI